MLQPTLLPVLLSLLREMLLLLLLLLLHQYQLLNVPALKMPMIGVLQWQPKVGAYSLHYEICSRQK